MDLAAQTEVLAKLDSLTKQGQRLLVLKELSRLIKSGLTSSIRPQLARIANRNHSYVLALRILHPLIREDREKMAEAGSEALNIYATSLMWIGALEESQECLHRIKGSTDALLTEAFVYFAQWDYIKSIPPLLKYINSSQTSPYQKLVGRINLLAAYIAFGDLKLAKDVFEPLIQELQSNPNYKLLHGNCLELRAQIAILDTDYKSALNFLGDSEKSLSDQPGRYLLYVNKWKAVCNLALSPQDSIAKESLLKVKDEALLLKNWETIRDCDFHLARLSENHDLLQRILLGTPYQGYHDRVQSLFGVSMSQSRRLEFCPSEPSTSPIRTGLDLNKISENAFLNSTSWPLIRLMTKDIYRPPRMGVVFNGIYGREYFDPFTSPQRVRNSIFRFNEWAEQNSCEFKIKIHDGDFKLVGAPGLSILTTQRERPLDSWQAALMFFKQQNESRSFSSSDLAKILGITQRSAVSILQKGLGSNKIQKIGKGRNSRYIFFSGRRAA